MAWLSKNTFSPSDALHADDLNNLANDQRAWGGDVNGGGHHLSNVIIDSYIPGGVGQTLLSITHIVPAVGDTSSWLSFDGAPAGSPARWRVGHNNAAESTGNVGSDFAIGRHSDAGAFIDSPISIRRSDGLITMGSQKWTGPIDGGGQTLTNVVIAGGASQTPWVQNIDGGGFYLKNALSVGLGFNASPGYPLDVRGGGGNPVAHFSFDGTDQGGYMYVGGGFGFTLSAGGAPIAGVATAKSGGYSNIALGLGSISFSANVGLTPGTSFTPATIATLLSTGRLGIGITAPAYPLDVVGDINTSGQFRVNGVPFVGGVPPTRQVIAGSGLTGGGPLSADVTLTAPALGASGASHRAGIAPDPGATLGATRYLREDATWAIPAGAGGGLTDPTTTLGDFIVRGAAATTRLPVGANGQVLTADSTQALGVKWAAGGGGQTPWTQNVNANGFALYSASAVAIGGPSLTDTLNVAGAQRIYGPPIGSNVGNSMAFDFAAPVGRIVCWGPSASTYGSVQIGNIHSDGSGGLITLTVAAGFVGVGTNAPAQLLTVIPPINAVTLATSNQLTIGEASNNVGYRLALGYWQDSTIFKGVVRALANGAETTLLLNPSGGFVGIGTTTPVAPLTVISAYAEPSLTHASAASMAWNTPGTTLALSQSGTSPFTSSFQAKSVNADGFITPIALNPMGGNVGIGLTTPTAQLTVYGTGQTTTSVDTVSGALGGTLYLKDVSGAANAGGMVIFGAVQGYAFAAIKAIVQDGSNYSLGSLSFSLRQVNSTAALVETMRLDYGGFATFPGKLVAGGYMAPTEAITVAGAVRITGTLTNYVASSLITDFALGGGRFWSFGADIATKGTFSFIPITANGTVGIGTTITATGVGIGNATPLVPLHVYCQAGGPPATSGTNQPNGAARFRNVGSGGNSLDIGAYTTSPFGLWLQGTDQNSLALNYPLVLNPNGGKVQIGPGGIYAPNLRGFNSDTEAGTAGLVQGDFYFNISTGGVYRKL